MGCSHSGFTLMEVMVTMAILAIITGIAIPAYNGYMHNSYLTECQNEVAAIQLAQQEFFLENNEYFPKPANTVNGITNIETASAGLYVSGYYSANAVTWANNLANANCTYSLTSTAPPAASYTITVTGTNHLDPATDSFTFTK
jgi:prepilin-type N-terminal cleavage/methylation domain-containing protein